MVYCSIKSVIYKFVAFCLTLTMMFGYFIILYAVLSCCAGQMPAPPPAVEPKERASHVFLPIIMLMHYRVNLTPLLIGELARTLTELGHQVLGLRRKLKKGQHVFLSISRVMHYREEEQYVLNFDSPVYVCADDVSQGFVDANNVEVKRHNETTSFMTGSFTFLKEIGPCTVVGLVVEKESNGRVEVMLTHDICDLCAEIGPDSSYYKYLKYFGFPDSCPFEVGEYRIHDFLTDTDDLPVNRATEARYWVTLNFYQNPDCDCRDNREFVGCLKLDFVIEPM